MAEHYLTLGKTEDIDADSCPLGMVGLLLDADSEEWHGWCSCGWFMPGPAFDAEDAANAWGDHLDGGQRILFASISHNNQGAGDD